MKKINIAFLFLMIISGVWYSCTEDYFDGDISIDDWQPRFAIPLVNSTLTLEDIIIKSDTNGLVRKDPNEGDLLEVLYEGSVESPQGALAIDIPSQSFQEVFQLPAPIPPSPIGGSRNENFTNEFDFDNNNSELEIDSILLKNGEMNLKIRNDFMHNISVNVTFPTIKESNGNQLAINLDLSPAPNSSTPSVSERNIDLTGFTINMSEDQNGMRAINKIPFTIDATFNLTPNTGSDVNDAITMESTLNKLNFKELYGYVGQINLDLEEDTIFTEIFKNFVSGDIFFTNPSLDLTFRNSFGLPVDFSFDKLVARNSDKNPDNIQFNIPNPIALNSPTGLGSADTELLLDTSNSNVDDVISFLLKEIIHESTGRLNPNGRLVDRNFLTDTSTIDLNLKLKIPFNGRASNFILVDTLDFEFENEANNTEDALIRINAVNGFPLDVKLQLIFTDANFNIIDSLFLNNADPPVVQPIVLSSVVDANGRTVQPTSSTTDVVISTDRLDRWNQSEYTIIRAELESKGASNNETVRFFEDYRFTINIGIKSEFLVQ